MYIYMMYVFIFHIASRLFFSICSLPLNPKQNYIQIILHYILLADPSFEIIDHQHDLIWSVISNHYCFAAYFWNIGVIAVHILSHMYWFGVPHQHIINYSPMLKIPTHKKTTTTLPSAYCCWLMNAYRFGIGCSPVYRVYGFRYIILCIIRRNNKARAL